MKFPPKLITFASIFAATSAIAGPPVTVTFKNLGTATANYVTTNSNESATYTNASPKPAATVTKGSSNAYTVTSTISPDANFAAVRYQIGTKECVFNTTFINTITSGGGKVPTWNKNATASGGAVCTATITATNLTTYAWTVEFTMK